MKKNVSVSLRLLSAAAVSVLLLVLGGQCLALYHSDTQPLFSAEKVSLALRQILPIIIPCVFLILLSLLFHRPASRPPVPSLTQANRLRLMKKHIATLPENAQKEERKRLFCVLLAALGLLVCAAWCLAYLLNRTHFDSWQLDRVMSNMLRHVLPALLTAGLILYAASVYCDHSRAKECRLLQSVPKINAAKAKESTSLSLTIARILFFFLAILFIVLGAMNGGMKDMLAKAIKICTECIGLG